ncbi:MAG: type II toxin-antitoxin system VapC family toxin [Spirochaetales bacterium]|nr:type II toxin-antitoxin system VapC family toxin [Spirochaetales bacterium]
MYLLDTHVLLWLASNQENLPEEVIEIIKTNPNNLFISSITAFEITIKTIKKKLKLPLTPEKWIPGALKQHHIEEIPMDSRIAIRSALLPAIHNDPCDRVIIATAMIHHMVILTKDQTIPKYPEIKTTW